MSNYDYETDSGLYKVFWMRRDTNPQPFDCHPPDLTNVQFEIFLMDLIDSVMIQDNLIEM